MIATAENIRAIRAIAENLNDTKRLLPYIKDSEMMEVMDSLGAKLYKAIDTNTRTTLTYTNKCGTEVVYTAEEYATLLDGGYYCEDEYRCQGLIPAICYLAYSRFVRNNQLNVTGFGITVKQGSLSEPADTKAVMIHANENEKIGKTYLQSVYEFIKYKEGLVIGSQKISGSKIKVIGD